MHTISIKLPDDLYQRFDAATLKRGMNKSTLIRQMLQRFLDETTTSPNTFLDLAQDLCGVVNGPKDLAIHPKHMEGYGE